MASRFKTGLFAVSGSIILIGTIFGGWLQGRMVTRWGADELLKDAARRLEQPIAERHGNWRLVGEEQFSPDVVRMLQCPAHLCRNYVHQQTGDTIQVFVIIGPPGPVGAHTPEICYSSQDFAISGDRTPVTIVDRQQREHSLWQVSVEPRHIGGESRRVLYGWGTGQTWSATESPRFAFSSEPYLYKIQVAGPPSKPGDDFNPCEDFLRGFLSEVSPLLMPTRQETPAVHPSN